MQISRDKNAKKQKEIKSAKKRAKKGSGDQTDSLTDNPHSTVDGSTPKELITVSSEKKTSNSIYAAVATVCLMIVGAGFVAYE